MIKITTLEEFMKEYCIENTYKAHEYFDHYTWLDKTEDGDVIGFISYFPLEGDKDMIITHNKDNIYTLKHWRILRKLLKARHKYVVINSDPKNKALIKGAAKYGGYFEGDDIHFPIEEE